NAFYGVLASSFYRFNDPKVGASITAFARERIKGIIADLEADGVKVVYADTDSVFFQSPTPGLEPSLEFARKTAERFSRGRISMEVDKVYRSLFSHGRKKRYAGKVAWPAEGEIVVRGYEIRDGGRAVSLRREVREGAGLGVLRASRRANARLRDGGLRLGREGPPDGQAVTAEVALRRRLQRNAPGGRIASEDRQEAHARG